MAIVVLARRLGFASLCLLMSPPNAQAGLLSRAKVEVAINEVASRWGVDADNYYLSIHRMRTPRTGTAVGFACGEILPMGGLAPRMEMRSFHATLVKRHGDIAVVGIAPLYKPVEELLLETICNR